MKKVLVVFGEGTKKNVLMDSALFFKEKLGYEIIPLYIKDVRRDEIIPATMDGMIVNLSNNSFSEERELLEAEEMTYLKDRLKTKGIVKKLNVEFGFPWEIIKEYLKLADVLMFEKGEILSEAAITVLKNQFKPVVMVGAEAIKDFTNIAIASDDGVKVNKSVSNFMRIFPEITDFTMLTLQYELEDNKLLTFMEDRGKKVTVKDYSGDSAKEDYLNEIKKYDLLVMGNLSKSYFFEKIIGKKGLNIMEKSQVSIFIG